MTPSQTLRLITERDRLKAINAELLEALRFLLELCEEELDENRCPEMTKARAAIAKATNANP